MSEYDDSRKRTSKIPIDEITKEVRLISYARPASAKKHDSDTTKIPKRCFSRLNTGMKGRKNLQKEKNTLLVEKLKPNKILMDKERLYIENMQLKIKNNELLEDIVKYKAKFFQLQREKQKKDDTPNQNDSQSSFLVRLLKQNIRELKNELHSKDMVITKQRKNMKLTKFLEMELEIKAYIDECTRLKHYLEEIIKEKEEITSRTNEISYQPNEQMQNLMNIIEDDKRKIKDLTEKLRGNSMTKYEKSPKAKEDSSAYIKEIEKLKTELSSKQSKFSKDLEYLQQELKTQQSTQASTSFKLEEANKLIASLYEELKSIRQRNSVSISPPKFILVLNEAVTSLNQSISQYLLSVNPENPTTITQLKLIQRLKQYSPSISQLDLESVMSCIQDKNSSEISVGKLIDFYATFGFELNPAEQKNRNILDLFQHLELRMQLHRVPKENLLEALIGPGSQTVKTIESQEIVMIFTNSPFSFSRKEAGQIVEYLFESKKAIKYSDLVSRFYGSTADWEIFTPKDEENFDSYLIGLVSKNMNHIEKYCGDKDPKNKGVISLQEFNLCLGKVKISLPQRVYNYLLVLFYSHNMTLNTVPYKQFLQAYATPDESTIYEDHRNNITQKYLEQISQSLIDKEKSVRDIFKHDSNGNVLAEDFINAVKLLDMEEIPKEDLLIILEGLQHNPEDRVVCVHVQDLEEILENYGVPVYEQDSESSVESLADGTVGHVQKVSLLDAAQLEIAEMAEEKQGNPDSRRRQKK